MERDNMELRRIVDKLLKGCSLGSALFEDDAYLSDAKLDTPLFVSGKPGQPNDHKCGNCPRRIVTGDGDKADCTIVSGGISLAKGTCDYWNIGDKPSTEADKSERRMDHQLAGYLETDKKVRCETCRFDNNGYCTLWRGKVKATDCCISWAP
jgi:hypothetical protein